MWWIIGIVGVALLAAALWGPIVSNVEQPKYQVVESSGNVEIRDYAPMIVAEVDIPGERRDAIGKGFRVIADYIVMHRSTLHQMPTGLFLLCDSTNALRHIDDFETRVGWRARFAAAFTYGSLGFVRGMMRSILHAFLRHIEGSVADRGVKELTALADAMLGDLGKARRRT